MKHLSWDYKGYDDLNLGFEYGPIQNDWNPTLLGSINEAWGDSEENINIFISKKFIAIIESICIYDPPTKTLGNIRFIPIDLETPKLYIVAPHIMKFTGIDSRNYASVVIKNYK